MAQGSSQGDTDVGCGGRWDPIQAQNPQQPVDHRRRASWPRDSPEDDRAGAREGLRGGGVGPQCPWFEHPRGLSLGQLRTRLVCIQFVIASGDAGRPAAPVAVGRGGWARAGHPPCSTEPTEDTSPGSEVRGSVWDCSTEGHGHARVMQGHTGSRGDTGSFRRAKHRQAGVRCARNTTHRWLSLVLVGVMGGTSPQCPVYRASEIGGSHSKALTFVHENSTRLKINKATQQSYHKEKEVLSPHARGCVAAAPRHRGRSAWTAGPSGDLEVQSSRRNSWLRTGGSVDRVPPFEAKSLTGRLVCPAGLSPRSTCPHSRGLWLWVMPLP